MSNSYTRAAFELTVTSAEADMLMRVVEAVDLIADRTIALDTLETRYPALGEDFAALFPRTADSPFDGLLDLFPYINVPSLDFTIDFGEADDTGQVILVFSGENFGLETAARLIQRCA